MEKVKIYKKMFEDIKFHSNIFNNELVKEYKQLKTEYKNYSIFKEEKCNKYLKKFVVFNENKGLFTLKKDLEKESKIYKNEVYLRTKELERITKEESLTPIFITLTLPSEFHPFKILNNKEDIKDKRIYINNDNFLFDDIDTRIKKGYENLNLIFRDFYKLIKRRENKDIKFIKIIEPHKSLIPHLHCILYINIENFDEINKKFNNIIKKYRLQKCEFEKLKKSKGSSYIIKYILKNFNDEDLRIFDGYKKVNKIRVFTMSNLELSSTLFKKIYINNKEENEKVLKEIKEEKTEYKNLYEYYTKNTIVNKIFIDKNGQILKEINDENIRKFEIFKIVKIDNKLSNVKTNKLKQKFLDYKQLKTDYKNLKVNENINILEKRKILNLSFYKIKHTQTKITKDIKKVYTTNNITIYKDENLIYNKKDYQIYDRDIFSKMVI